MKNSIVVVSMLFMTFVVAQTNKTDGNAAGVSQNMAVTARGNMNNLGATAYFYNSTRPIDGTVYLFDKWENKAVIFTSGDNKFMLKNINLNLKRSVFESKISEDSLFTFNFNNIDKFVINNKEYKNFYWNDDNRVYEIIFEGDEIQILKGFTVALVEGSANPMLGRKNDRYIRKENYFVRQDEKIKPFKLKKKRVLKLVEGDEEKARMIMEYVERNDLSYKNEYDVKKMLEYSAKN